MGKFEKEAKVLLDAIGGKENVSAVTHCATRMRSVLIDEKKADVKAIEEIGAVKGTFTNAGQFQVIIGNDVPIFYNDFTAVSGIEGVSKEAAKAAAKINQNAVQRVMTMLAEIFTPIIPAIIVGGLILGFRNILEGVQIQAFGQKVVDGVLQFTKDGELSIFKNDSLIQTIDVEFAKNEMERSLGLMYRSSMDEHQGMWFIFPEEAPRSFYMRNTEISLDIIYLDKDKKVVSIAKNARPYDETSLPSEKPAMYVLEINGGLADKWGIDKGDRVEVK